MSGIDRVLEDAVKATVMYADLFDFPLDRNEVWRDLIGVTASRDQLGCGIDQLLATGDVIAVGPYVVLPGRTGLLEIRRSRGERAARLWPTARRLGTFLGQIPFVRMVAVTGSLAADNPSEKADLDYLIVTSPDRLWLARAMAVVLARLARPSGARLCPNYLLSLRVLELEHRDLFTAHELLQAVPVVGRATYQDMLDRNQWSAAWLPNRFRLATAYREKVPVRSDIQRAGEAVLTGSLGRHLEAWESRRKLKRLAIAGSSARFTADHCEGHYNHHRQRILGELQVRCEAVGLDPSRNRFWGHDDRDREPVNRGERA